ncbi:MAG: DUF6364 family protein [Bacteroidota bacterium]
MKNITLSIPDDLLAKSREYAKRQGKSLNDMVRELLKRTVSQNTNDLLESIDKSRSELGIDTKRGFNREELYER